MLQTALLRSLQHRFATQQALDTPAGWPPRDAQQEDEQQEAAQPQQVQHDAPTSPRDDDEDSFQIFSQLAYEPTFLSQRPPELDAEPGGGTSQVATQTQAELGSSQWNNGPAGSRAPAGSLAAAAGFGAAEAANNGGGEGDDLDWPPASQQCTQPHSQPPQPDEAVPRASGVALKTTPALQSVERVQVDGGGASGTPCWPGLQCRMADRSACIPTTCPHFFLRLAQPCPSTACWPQRVLLCQLVGSKPAPCAGPEPQSSLPAPRCRPEDVPAVPPARRLQEALHRAPRRVHVQRSHGGAGLRLGRPPDL